MKIETNPTEKLLLDYDVSGSGPDVLLVHGLGLSSKKTWKYQVPELSQRYRVHAYDVRGFGKSINPSGKFSVQQHAYDLYELLRVLKLERIILIGFSMGGWISQQFALDHPEMLRALILSCTTSSLRPEGARRFVERADRVEQSGLESLADEQMKNTFTSETFEKRPDLLSFYRENFLSKEENNPKSYAAMFRALTVTNFTPQLGRIKCPTLILCGGADQGITRGNTPTDAAEVLHDGINGSKFVVIPNGGHYAHLEQAEQWNRIVIEFITGIVD